MGPASCGWQLQTERTRKKPCHPLALMIIRDYSCLTNNLFANRPIKGRRLRNMSGRAAGSLVATEAEAENGLHRDILGDVRPLELVNRSSQSRSASPDPQCPPRLASKPAQGSTEQPGSVSPKIRGQRVTLSGKRLWPAAPAISDKSDKSR